MNHVEARPFYRAGYRLAFGVDPTLPEIQCVQAVGKVETSHGEGWRPPGNGSFNMGAVQKGASWKGATFTYTDTRPNEDGTSTPYQIEFRKYKSREEGAKDLAMRVLTGGMSEGREKLVAPFAKSGDTYRFSAGLYDTVYYQGFGRTRTERISHHHTAILNACAGMARELGEPMPDGSEPPRVVRVLRLGANDAALDGSPIAALQGIVGAKVDGVFGEGTRTAVKAWQLKHRLNPDGVWGPVCYQVVQNELDGETIDALFGYELAA